MERLPVTLIELVGIVARRWIRIDRQETVAYHLAQVRPARNVTLRAVLAVVRTRRQHFRAIVLLDNITPPAFKRR